MPELPEAEANRLRIERECLNRTIEAAEPGDNVTYIELPGANERGRLVGHQFTQTHRHGKLIFAGSKSGPWMSVHLGMTGKLIPFDEGKEDLPSATKFLVSFEGDRRLAFRCPRKLGWVRIVESPEAEIERIGFGPDALEIGKDAFVEVIGSTNGSVKGALMEQRKLAGIGNLWSDEILFEAGVAPQRKGSELSEQTLADMFDIMRRHLKAVVKTEADYSQLPDDWLVRNRKKGADCPKCGGTITTASVSGRTAYFCEKHQD